MELFMKVILFYLVLVTIGTGFMYIHAILALRPYFRFRLQDK